MQYLGTKLRTLDDIVSAVSDLAAPGTHVVDMFAGSGVVSRRLSDAGLTVASVDVQSYSAIICRALLGVGKTQARSDLFERLQRTLHDATWLAVAGRWLDEEDRAVRNGDGDALVDLSRRVPQVWRSSGATSDMLRLFDAMSQLQGRQAFGVPAIIGTHYSGTYFGIRQAGELDQARAGIESLSSNGVIDSWEADVLLTALIGAMSEAVFSAGKHFAQPFDPKPSNMKFATKRLLADRSVNVWKSIESRVNRILAAAVDSQADHRVFCTSLEHLSEEPLALTTSVFYADPPYTAQQYSRFYHLPETLSSYVVPRLSTTDGVVTKGLYPEERFKSRFCSAVQAPQALADLCRLADRHRASLVLSYSATEGGSTGNRRMVSLDQVIRICRSAFGERRVDLQRLDFSYRQFNSHGLARSVRSEAEYLIVCHAPC